MTRVAYGPALALALLMGASLVLRVGALGTGYWIDEGIAVGIASHDLADIPRILSQDGNPPLYYLLLHGWMGLFGEGEAATRALSLLFALLAIPASFWAGSRVFDRRAGALAALGAAGAPFLTYYAQETRMYSLVVLLSVLASASFALAFVRGERRHVAWLGVWLGLLLYTHTWGLFLAAAMGAAWVVLWRRGDVAGGGARLALVLALVYAPWLPSVVFQAAHTAAPWAERPPPIKSNVRTVSTSVAPQIRPGDLVVATQPEQVPALYRYLPEGVAYRTPMGFVLDPRQTDWRDGLARLRAGQAERELLPAVARLDRGRRC